MHYQCLIVDDELELAQMTCEYFQMFDVSCAYVGSVAGYDEFMKEFLLKGHIKEISVADGGKVYIELLEG